jgi:hypothetical protein
MHNYRWGVERKRVLTTFEAALAQGDSGSEETPRLIVPTRPRPALGDRF